MSDQNSERPLSIFRQISALHAIQVQETPALLQRTLALRFKLLSEALVEATDRAGDFERLPTGFERLPYLVGARLSHEHLRQPVCDVRFIERLAFQRLGVELTRAVVFAL